MSVGCNVFQLCAVCRVLVSLTHSKAHLVILPGTQAAILLLHNGYTNKNRLMVFVCDHL